MIQAGIGPRQSFMNATNFCLTSNRPVSAQHFINGCRPTVHACDIEWVAVAAIAAIAFKNLVALYHKLGILLAVSSEHRWHILAQKLAKGSKAASCEL